MDHRKKRELPEKIRMEIIDQHFKGKGYKSIAKELDIPLSTVASLIRKVKDHGSVANLPGRGRKKKIGPRLNKRIAKMVSKEPSKTSKDIQADLEGQGLSVSRSTIRRFLSNSGLKVGLKKGPKETPLKEKPVFELEKPEIRAEETP